MSVEDTLAERGKRYGDFTDHAAVCQRIKLAMIAGAAKWACLPDTHKQALEVIADKIARILTGDPNYADNWHDIQGYAKLVEDRLPAAQPQHPDDIYSALVAPKTPLVYFSTPSAPREDVYAEFAARMGTPGPKVSIHFGAQPKCAECGYPTDAAGTHYATCSQLTAPEEYKAEAQVAFDELESVDDTIVNEANGSFDWQKRVTKARSAIEAEEDATNQRMDNIARNGNDGEHYDDPSFGVRDRDPFYGAPDWVKYKAQDERGQWYWYENKPIPSSGGLPAWLRDGGEAVMYDTGEPNPHWHDTLIQRP